MKRLFFIPLVFFLALACKKDKAVKPVEIYLLKSFQLVAGKCQVDGASVVLEDSPLVLNAEIRLYNQAEYFYYLDDIAIQKLKSLTPRTPLAVTVDKKVIFYGIYMPSIMSSTCGESITMDLMPTEKKIFFRLGYPWGMATIDDQRNNPVILSSFRNQRKLR